MYYIEKGLIFIKLQCEKCGMTERYGKSAFFKKIADDTCELKKAIECQNPLCEYTDENLICRKPPQDSLQQFEISINERLKLKDELERMKVSQLAPPQIHCPKCNSTQITANKKGFGIGKAAVGAAVTGGVGLLAGFIGSGKVKITCLNCGFEWDAGK